MVLKDPTNARMFHNVCYLPTNRHHDGAVVSYERTEQLDSSLREPPTEHFTIFETQNTSALFNYIIEALKL